MKNKSYKEQVRFFFDNLKLQKISWNIIAEDGSLHPFTNHDVINSFQNSTEDSLKDIFKALHSMCGDRMKINTFLKGIATHYCDNRFSLIQALKTDYENQTSKEGKQFFYNLLAKFNESDLTKAGVLEFWKKINENK